MTAFVRTNSARLTHKFITLDGLRGVAALAVLAYHSPDMTLRNLAPGSYLAVDLFFVLSGFIVARVYQDRFSEGLTVQEFMLIRLVRLYPLYILGSLVGLSLVICRAILNPGMDTLGISTVLAAFFFLPTLERVEPLEHLSPLNFPAWSLFFEIIVNFGFALIARYLTDRRLGMLIGIGAILLAMTSLHFGSLGVGMEWDNLAGGAGRVIYSFFAGVAVERFYRRGAFPRIVISPLFAVAIILLLFVVPNGPWRAAFDAIVALAVLPTLILGSARREPGERFASVFAAIGTMSYAIYMLHVPIRDWLITVAPRVTGFAFAEFGVPGTMVFVSIVFGVSFVADRWGDQPARRWLGRLAKAANGFGRFRPTG